MVDDNVIGSAGGNTVRLPAATLGLARVTRSDAEVPDKDVVGFDGDTAADQRDARRRGRLPGYRQERFCDADVVSAKVDHAANFKHDNVRPSLRLPPVASRGLWR